MKSKISTAVGLAVLLMGVATAHAADPAKPRSQRGELVHQIVMKWGRHVQEAYRADVGQWAQSMGPAFAGAPIPSLERAAKARTFAGMNDALLGKSTTLASSANVTPQALGDAAGDLTFVPVEPCRILDTRVAVGAIAANTVREVDVTAIGSYASQGGSATDCGGVGSAGSFAAAVINFTWVAPAQQGYFTAFPHLGTQPLAATAIYGPGQIASNLAVVKLDQTSAMAEMNIYSERQLHLVADIVGYYVAPAPTALECEEVASVSTNINAGATANVFAPSCAVGYTAVEVQCRPSSFDLRLVGSWSGHCNFINQGGVAASAVAAARCCRVPGR